MWMKHSKQYHHILNSSHFRGSSMKSWEEQAFVEDSQGPLGGFIWPPRSYSCSFCKREFRSAQALGGHMNVHRRDRARLKQSSNTTNGSQETSDSNPSNFASSAPAKASSCKEITNLPLFAENLREESRVEGHVETKLCVGLNFGGGGDGKKRKREAVMLPFLLKACSNEKEIDLELRLGDSSVVN
ncbi:hypothetical protein ACET3Z_011899 [Daucus carota]